MALVDGQDNTTRAINRSTGLYNMGSLGFRTSNVSLKWHFLLEISKLQYTPGSLLDKGHSKKAPEPNN